MVDLIYFRFPLDFDRSSHLQSTYDNHASATKNLSHEDTCLKEELKYGVLYGPFQDLPFPVHISPLMTKGKQGSAKRRTIMDLTWPKGAVMNTAIYKFVIWILILLCNLHPKIILLRKSNNWVQVPYCTRWTLAELLGI